MNEDLKFIKSVIKEEIKTWTSYRREIVDDVGEKDFSHEISLEVSDFLNNKEEFSEIIELEGLTKEIILEVLDDLMTDRLFPF